MSSNDAVQTNPDDNDDLTARFPKPEEVAVPTRDLPEPPKATYARPVVRRDTDPLPEGGTGLVANIGGRSRNLRSMGVAGTIGISLAVSIAVGTGMGWLLDKYAFGSPQPPWGLIAGFMLGVVSGFINLVRVANQLNRDADE